MGVLKNFELLPFITILMIPLLFDGTPPTITRHFDVVQCLASLPGYINENWLVSSILTGCTTFGLYCPISKLCLLIHYLIPTVYSKIMSKDNWLPFINIYRCGYAKKLTSEPGVSSCLYSTATISFYNILHRLSAHIFKI